MGSLNIKFNEYEKIFDKFLNSTKSFSNRNEKLKRSTQKHYEDLKFIPINLHNEHFVVESENYAGEAKTSCYDFVSVGAFTTMHTSKSIFPRVAESLMINEQSDAIIANEPILVFYSLKILILILNDLKTLRSTDDKIEVIFISFKFDFKT